MMWGTTMQAIELYPGNRFSGIYVAAPLGTVPVASADAGGRTAQELLRRIDDLTRFKAAFVQLSPCRERDFWHVVDNARLAASRGDADTMAAAIFALDVLSLELCDG